MKQLANNAHLQLRRYKCGEKSAISLIFIWFSYFTYLIRYIQLDWFFSNLLQQICKIAMPCNCSPHGCGGFAFHNLIS